MIVVIIMILIIIIATSSSSSLYGTHEWILPVLNMGQNLLKTYKLVTECSPRHEVVLSNDQGCLWTTVVDGRTASTISVITMAPF